MKRLLTELACCCCCFIAFISVTQALPVQNITEFGKAENVNGTASDNVCVHEDTIYAEGQNFSTSNPCETCTCDPPGFSCSLSSCDLKPGCKAIHKANQCCPEYVCECERNGKVYANGEKVEEPNPCKVCYCKGGEIKCALVTCYTRDDCEPGYVAGVCCPKYDHCPPLEMMKNKSTTPAPAPVIISDLKTESPPRAKTKDQKMFSHVRSEPATEPVSPDPTGASPAGAGTTPSETPVIVVMSEALPPETTTVTYTETPRTTETDDTTETNASTGSNVRLEVIDTEPPEEATTEGARLREEDATTESTTEATETTTAGYTSVEGIRVTEVSDPMSLEGEALEGSTTWSTSVDNTTPTLEATDETAQSDTGEVTTGVTDKLELRQGPPSTIIGDETTEQPYSTPTEPELRRYGALELTTLVTDGNDAPTATEAHQTYTTDGETELLSAGTSEGYTTNGDVPPETTETRAEHTTLEEVEPDTAETREAHTTLGETQPTSVVTSEVATILRETIPTTTGTPDVYSSPGATETHEPSTGPSSDNFRLEIVRADAMTEETREAEATTEEATQPATEDTSIGSIVKVIVPKTKDLEVTQRNSDGPAPIVVMISADQIQFLKLAEEPPMYVENRNSEEARSDQDQLGVVVVPRTTPTTVEMVKVVRGTPSSEANTTTEVDVATKPVNTSSSFNVTDFIQER